MKDNFIDEIRRKTGRELEIVAKDTAFYSEDERFIALHELEKRGPLSAELAELKTTFDPSCRIALIPESERPSVKIYRRGLVWMGTFAGGPLVAGYLIAENFKAFGQREKVGRTWVWASLATVVVFGAAMLIPEEVRIPNVLIPVACTVAAVGLLEHFQGARIAAHLAAGGRVYSWGRTILVSLVGFVVTLVALVAVAILLFPDPYSGGY